MILLLDPAARTSMVDKETTNRISLSDEENAWSEQSPLNLVNESARTHSHQLGSPQDGGPIGTRRKRH
jgi:hypothetical protein